MALINRILFGRNLRDVLNETRTVFVHGVKFKIRKIDPLTYLEGSNVMRGAYGEYKTVREASQAVTPEMLKKVRAQYRDTFLASVVYPKISRDKNSEGEEIPVDHLLTDWGLASELYAQITLYSHGKKKLKRARSLASSL
jgi:hypothetical protein